MRKFFPSFIVFSVVLAVFVPLASSATTDAELQQKIRDTEVQRAILLDQQKKLQTALDELSKDNKTLTGNVQSLDAAKKKLTNDLKITQASINTSNLTIDKLTNDINRNETVIGNHKAAIEESMRKLSDYDTRSVIFDLLTYTSLTEVWTDASNLLDTQNAMSEELDALASAQKSLLLDKKSKEDEKIQLVSLSSQLKGQKSVVEQTQSEKAKLLAETKSKETAYQKLLADNIALQKKFEADLFSFESQLHITLTPGSYPAQQHGILSWPLTAIAVTQYFGYTPEAAKLYKTTAHHGGVDFRASIGTPVFAAFEGTVTDTESVKFKNGCQYGKWVLISHPNGLSTIYGHFSAVLVKPGDTVTTGQIIGYSGQTGYATGPHLHLGLYVTSGVRIVDASSLGSTNCTGIKTVAAGLEAYLDPLAYLPSF